MVDEKKIYFHSYCLYKTILCEKVIILAIKIVITEFVGNLAKIVKSYDDFLEEKKYYLAKVIYLMKVIE